MSDYKFHYKTIMAFMPADLICARAALKTTAALTRWRGTMAVSARHTKGNATPLYQEHAQQNLIPAELNAIIQLKR